MASGSGPWVGSLGSAVACSGFRVAGLGSGLGGSSVTGLGGSGVTGLGGSVVTGLGSSGVTGLGGSGFTGLGGSVVTGLGGSVVTGVTRFFPVSLSCSLQMDW